LEPAYPLALTTSQHALIGETVEILGMTDHIMMETVKPLDQHAVSRMRGGNVPTVISIWAKAVRGATAETDLLKLVDFTERERKEIADARNDFIHGLFIGNYVSAGYVSPGYQTTSVVPFRSGKGPRQTSELEALRERAALVSCVVAHIDHRLKSNDPSPWLDRVKPLLT
jgi:hypothetical protein